MDLGRNSNRTEMKDIVSLISRRTRADRDMILPFEDFTFMVTELLKMNDQPGCCLIGAGHLFPDIEIAADRAEIKTKEALGATPFVGKSETVLAAVDSPGDIIFVANPGKVAGTTYSLNHLKDMARAVSDGLLIVDESYHDYYGITAFPLLDQFKNIVILRSFTASFGIMSSDAGYLLANQETLEAIKKFIKPGNFSIPLKKTILAAMVNDELLSTRLAEIHDEQLRVSRKLGEMGVWCRITAADFILMRVADPKEVGNQLARWKLQVDNLDGYPGLKNYIRYKVQSPLSNDKIIDAFRDMPEDVYKLKRPVKQKTVLRKAGEEVVRDPEPVREEVTADLGSMDIPIERFKNSFVIKED